MENVWSTRKKENLYYILAEDYSRNLSIENVFSKTAVVVYLYYEDTVEYYLTYIDRIPHGIEIYIISSNQNTLEKIRQYVRNRKQIYVIEKKNRGRDVSALLITARNIFSYYEYVCFIHDKKAKEYTNIEDLNLWIRNLWDNTLKSALYIKNVLDTLVSNKELGLLVPPEPIGDNMNAWYTNAWYGEYEGTVELANKLQIHANMERKYPPISLGTVFWCKTDALKKLFDIPWDYCDFHDEPLPEGGTLSHAVERVFAYVAQDAGYKTGIVMTSSYASELLSNVQDKMKNTYDFLRNEMRIFNYEGLKKYQRCEESFRRLADNNDGIYIYGAGIIGEECINILKHMEIFPKAVIISETDEEEKSLGGIPIVSLHSLKNRNIGIIVAVGRMLKEEIKTILDHEGYCNYICYTDI